MTRFQTDKLAIGTAQFGSAYGIANQTGLPDGAQISAILDAARAAGIRTLDTAILYGDGASETALGNAGTKGFDVVSKLPPVPPGCKDISGWVSGQAEASLERLKLEKLHGLLLHAPGQLNDPAVGADLYAALLAARDRGLTTRIGISIYEPNELDALMQVAPAINLVQAPCNIIDRRLLTSGWADRLAANGVELHTRSAFLQGLLLMRAQERPAHFSKWSALFAAWDAWLVQHQIDPLSACLKFLLSFPQIDRIIVGVEQRSQLEQILSSAAADLAVSLPDTLASNDTDLINPARWSQL